MTFNSVYLSGANASEFELRSSCSTSSYVAPRRHCDMYITFSPTSAGNKNATIGISSNAGSQNIVLAGTGTGGSQQGGDVDLAINSFNSPGAGSNNLGFSATVTVANLDTGSAGPFKVKIYLSMGSTPTGGQLLVNGTQTVSGLGAGQSNYS